MGIFVSSASFTRPADTTAYTTADLVANSVTAGSVTPLSFSAPPSAQIWRLRAKKSTATATNANFTLFLYTSSPTVSNGDNGAFVSIYANFLGSISMDMTGSTFSDSCGGVTALSTPIGVIVGPVYGLVKAAAGYTPASAEIFTFYLEMHL